ncbi:MAG: ETC complex I subunit [Alphaproteobacteria bacterium]|nr:ETC complex I subunit [Alphaproteobacteria bacterium]
MQVRIFRPAASLTQGSPWADAWRLEVVSAIQKRPEPFMGWLAAEDGQSTMKGRLAFDTQQAAIAFAQKQGWLFEVEE